MIADDGNAVGFQDFQRQRQIQNGFGARADDGDRGLPQFAQVGADVHWLSAMDAADSAGGENPDAGPMGDHHGSGDGGGAVALLRQNDGEVSPAAFADIFGLREIGQLFIG